MSAMRVDRIADGLWRWTARHPAWTPAADGWESDVGCLYVETEDAIALVDPLVPPDGGEEAVRFWRALDGDVERAGVPVHVVLTSSWHARSTDRIAARYGNATVWAPADALGPIEASVDRRYGHGRELPAGLRAWAPGVHGVWESLLLAPRHRAVIAGDVLQGAPDGGVRVMPAGWIEVDDAERATRHGELVARLRGLLDHAVEHVLVSHGEPRLGGGRAALAAALGG